MTTVINVKIDFDKMYEETLKNIPPVDNVIRAGTSSNLDQYITYTMGTNDFPGKNTVTNNGELSTFTIVEGDHVNFVIDPVTENTVEENTITWLPVSQKGGYDLLSENIDKTSALYTVITGPKGVSIPDDTLTMGLTYILTNDNGVGVSIHWDPIIVVTGGNIVPPAN
jgi:hypothetical protein